MRLPATDEEFEDELWDQSRRGPAAAAAYCRRVLDAGVVPKGGSRAGLLIQLGEYSEMAGDSGTAERAFREAVAERPGSDRYGPDPRFYLAEWCINHGDPDEGGRLLDELWRSRPRGVPTYIEVGELLHERGDAAAAIKWLTAGAMRTLRDDDAYVGDLRMILAVRRRVRLEQGFDEDDYDLMVEELSDDSDGDEDDFGPA